MAIIRDFLRLRSLPFRRKNCDLPPDLAPCSYTVCRPNEAFFPLTTSSTSSSLSSAYSDSRSQASSSSSSSSFSSAPSPAPRSRTPHPPSSFPTGTPTSSRARARTLRATQSQEPIVISSYSTPVQVPILSIPKPRKRPNNGHGNSTGNLVGGNNGNGKMGTKKSKVALVEIFQSQGCSSCPPANANVIELMNNYPSVLLLTYEVTYWDYLGWEDSFGNREFDRRQREYAAAFGNESVFTPQVVVNGRADGVGNTFRDLNKIVSKGIMAAANEDLTRLDLEAEGNSILISGGQLDVAADVYLVRYMPKPADVNIRRGENAGRCIPHRNVVVDIKNIGEWKGGSMVFNIEEERGEGIERAVLLQKGRGGPVLAAAKLERM
ncbi:hypothetical protein DRE_04061 [Drechslerella stenobrocha 248]|uniref:DUF1223-domain-containing protein n=1 Tax=Drechslerella stenobrocha 248 TaxID=1043628 RepID=W7HTA8_9PEZI|nr:hypothetical protein DRE_04061 [Drechslerella stenobrocha 248]